MTKQRTTEELRRDFQIIRDKYRAVPFVRMDGDISDEEQVTNVLNLIKKAGYGGISPIPVLDARRSAAPTTPTPGTEEYWNAYGKLLAKAKKMGLQVVYYDDADFPSGRYAGQVIAKYPEAVAQVLVMREYACTEGELTRRKLDTDGVTMSVVAYEVDTGELLDLREYVMDDMLVWDTPDGNWNILQFVCKPVTDSVFVNFLNYEASRRFVECAYEPFCERFSDMIGSVVQMSWYDDLQYLAPNRRMWSPDFNEVFMKEYGFDPALFYPALFFDIRDGKEYYTAHLMQCRAKMFADGFFKAVDDYAKEHGLTPLGHVSESKTAAISNLFGDAMLMHKNAGAVGLDMIHAYMYGFNGLKIAASAASNFEKEIVACEMYKGYARMNPAILYKEAMNVFARGVNFIMPDVMQMSGDTVYNHDISLRNPEYKEILPAFNDFAARCQAMLQGGSHVCDIAMLYPIESLHSKVYLYDQQETTFQFPPVLQFADYMSNINSVLNYCGRDLTVLHPDVFCERGRAENGILHIDNNLNPESYRILILPAMTIISIRTLRLVREFYHCGGKIIATSALPFKLMEDDPAAKAEAAEILFELFGVRENEVNYVSDYEMHKNENGGMAIYLRSSMTDLDGTEYVEANRLNETLWQFDTPVDIVFEHLPRIAHSGILALNLIAFRNSGANIEGIRSGGVFNYIHKHHDGCEVYYISNTTVKDYAGNIVIRGRYKVEEWDPHTGKTRTLAARPGYVRGYAYTSVSEAIAPDHSVFLVCVPISDEGLQTEENTFEDFAALQKYYNTKQGKKTISLKPKLFNRS
ncbi:MAG: hypothetical protein MJ175_06070 [Clostridia bacterium]|nr:hypothetical protein [Clostridia bacterium]